MYIHIPAVFSGNNMTLAIYNSGEYAVVGL